MNRLILSLGRTGPRSGNFLREMSEENLENAFRNSLHKPLLPMHLSPSTQNSSVSDDIGRGNAHDKYVAAAISPFEPQVSGSLGDQIGSANWAGKCSDEQLAV